MATEAYPLHWPEGWKRTRNPKSSRFDTNMVAARDGLIHEIKLIGGKDVILSTNIPLRNDGLPYARYKVPEDKGVAVYFQLNNCPQVFACDQWDRIEDNMQAIRKTIDAIRGIERWGSSEMMNRIYRGFQALAEQAGASAGDNWWTILEVDPTMTLTEIESNYRLAAKKAHPDQIGGDIEKMKRLNWAIAEARIAKK